MSFQKLIKATGIILLVLVAQVSFAQTKTITGKVTDSKDGSGMPGVTVSATGGSAAVQTRSDGTYSIVVPASTTSLSFSNVGFTTVNISLAGRSSVDVTLTASATALSEVVVIGYGTARKKDVTGAITTVSSKDFQKGNITTPEQLIAGKVAGVSIISNGGRPGSGSQILIRGGASLNASNQPLIVIDGVPVENSGIAGGNNPLSFINSNDIESFTVLKDASATAIYGTRASNGIIMITTKKGKSGKFKANFTSTNSISVLRDKVAVLTGDEVRSIVNAKGTAAQKAQLGTANTDWQEEIYQKAFASDNNISFSGGLKNFPYRASIGYLNQEGILKTDHLEKISVGLALNPVLLNNHLKLDINLKGSQQQYRFADQGAIGSAVYFDPTKTVMSGNKRFNGYFEWLNPETTSADFGKPWNRAGRNPVAMLTDRFDESDSKRYIANVQADYKFHFLPDLHLNVNLGGDFGRGRGDIFISDSSSIAYLDSGYYHQYKQNRDNIVFETYLNYSKDLTKMRSRVELMGGYAFYNYFTRNYNYANYTARGKLKQGSQPTYPVSDGENNLISWFGRANFALYNKYIFTGTLRRDGSSKFGTGNKWATFPAVAFAWRIKEESFLKSNRTFSDLKLRLGYGQTGQQDGIASFIYESNYFLSNITAQYPFGVSYNQMYRPTGRNEGIKWEETTTYNAALDYGFLDNRITGSIDFYLKKTKDLLNNIPQPAGTNFSAFIIANVGTMENKGVEFTINAQPVRNKVLTWDVSFNATYNKNTITNLTVIENDPNYKGQPAVNISGSQGFAFLRAVGTPRSTFYLYHQIYKDGKPVEGLFEDVNRDGIINEDDKYKGKNADPNLFFGFSTNVGWKKWNAGFVMRSAFNNYVYNNIYSNNGRLNGILNAYVLGNASRNYLETNFTGSTEQQPLSDYYIENASFLKMDNLNIGYNAGQIMKQKATLRLNLTVQNVFTITKYSGLDPEISNGVDNNLYPRPRIFSLGINLDF